MRNTYKLLFYLKKNAPLRNGNVPIMARITICGQRVHFSTHLSVKQELWCPISSMVKGHGLAADRLNRQLFDIRYRIEQCYRTLFQTGTLVTPVMVKEAYLGLSRSRSGLVGFFRRHNEEFEKMLGISRCRSTYNKYRCVCRHVENYVRTVYRRDEIAFDNLDRNFLTGFHAYVVRE